MTGKVKDRAEWDRASLDELRAWRREALKLAEEAEEKAMDILVLKAMYEKVAPELKNKAYKLIFLVKDSETKGYIDLAEQQRGECEELRKLIELNYQLADEKGREAIAQERDAHEQKSLADSLVAEIKNHLDAIENREL